MASANSISGMGTETRVKNGLCLLSLDGGGVRGLSTILILKGIMQQINAKRQLQGLSHVRPCDVFDLIGGTSTGGLIAIMLGRLEMDVQPCIDAYSELSRRIFSKKSLPVDWRGHVNGRYKASELEDAIKKIVKDSGSPEDAPLSDGKGRGCRVFVCAVRKENKAVARLRAYQSDTALIEDGATIWEAARATSAASSFFDPISIGKHGQEYVDAGLGCNNPVDEVWTEAQDIWSPEGDDIATLVKCFISIGTGNPGTSPIEDGVFRMFTRTLKDIATETEKTAEIFAKSHRGLLSQARYFRFNVDQGLQNVGLEEYKKEKEIVSATSLYMESQHMQARTQDCSQAMKDKQFWKGNITELTRLIFQECQHEPEPFRLMFSLAAAPEIDYFVGRASNLSSIESVLLPVTAAERKVVVLHGLGGIGKSQLAIEFAKKHRSDYTAVLWLNAKTEETLKQSFAASARRLPKKYFNQEILYGPQNEEVLGMILRDTKAWLDLPGNHQWLLIYDNVDNPKIPDNKRQNAYDIRPYFPEAHQGSILVTTRWKTLRIGRLLEVAKLSKDEESILLLEQTSGRDIRQDPKTKDLLKKLDGLPLALATAGAYLGLTSIPVSEYLHHHETSWLELQRTSPPLLSYADQTIYSTWNLSYIDIRKEDESAAKLLELWGYFDNQDLWYGLLKAGNDKYAPAWFGNIVGTKLAFQAAIAKLQKHALIESLTDSDGYAMHHCVHAWVKNVLCTAVEDQKLKLALTCFEKGVPFYPAPGDWITRQRMTSHSERCLQLHRVWIDEGNNSEETEQYFARFFHNLGVLYHDQGKPKEAESTYQRALISNEKLLGPHHIIILNTINNLGSLYCEQGKLIEAESIYQRALNGKVKAFGPDHTFTLNTVESLGILYNKQGKLTEAELLYQRALSGKEKVLGPDHTSTLDTVNNLGILYKEQGKLTEAELMYQRALNGYEKTLGHDHKFTLNTINNLGILYSEQGKLTEAESMYNRVLAGYEETLGHDHISALNTINNLGILYSEQGKLTEAESMYNRALAGYEETLGHDHKSTLDAAHNLGRLYSFQKDRLAEAESMYQRALTDYEETLGHDHRSTLDTVFNLGNLYSHQEDRLAEAESMYQRALTGFEETLGHDHIFTLDTVFNLGNLYSHQEDRLAEAESMYQRALAGFTRNPPLNPKSQLNTFYNLGLLSRKLQNFERAKECFKKAYQGYQTLLGPENAETIKALEQFNVEVERGKQGVEEEDTEGSSKTDCEPDSSL